MSLTAPLLIFGYGNPSRGDDAIAPHLLSRLAALNLPQVELLTDFQLQVEHALDLEGRELALFIDASIAAPPPYAFTRLQASRDASYTSHEMTPAAVLHVYRQIHQIEPPPCYLLAVRGEFFDLGTPLSEAAAQNADAAFGLLRELCREPRQGAWDKLQKLQAGG